MIDFLKSLCFRAIIDEKTELRKQLFVDDIEIFESKTTEFGHFQCNNAIKIARQLNIDMYDFSIKLKERIEKNIKADEILVIITKPGFINFKFTTKYIISEFKNIFNPCRINIGIKNKIILDYSSPNIAKDMHIGHLRSTVVGDCLSNLLKFLGHKVMKISHLGDWGTQFGLLIYYLKNIYGNDFFLKKISLVDLSSFYKLAQERYLNDFNFKNLSKKEVVLLQKKDKLSIRFWKVITNISKKEYKKIYSLLNVKLTYKGESFYSDLLQPLVKYLTARNIVSVSDGAKCIYLNKLFDLSDYFPAVIIQKSDGGYNYATTELAALYYRIKYNKPDKIIYITDVGQKLHFDMIFNLVKFLNFDFYNKVSLIHIPLGLMLNSDGKKIKTRSGKSERLIDILKESIDISRELILEKNDKIKFKNLNYISGILGINTVKYSDLSNKLDQNYIFDKKSAFKNTGNTAAFLMYAYVRICGIERKMKSFKFKHNLNIEISFADKAEIDLALIIIMYKEHLKIAGMKLNPNILTSYIYKLAEKFHLFFNNCTILNSANFYSRMFLCKATKKILKVYFNILGLKSVNRM